MQIISPVPSRTALERAVVWWRASLLSNSEQIAEIVEHGVGGPPPRCPRRATLGQLLRERRELLDPRELGRRAVFIECMRLVE